MATASCSTGVWRRHHLRHQDSGEAFTALRATASGEERGMGRILGLPPRLAMPHGDIRFCSDFLQISH